MIVNEQLAKGLKNRFFVEIEDRIKSGIRVLSKTNSSAKKSSSGWIKLVSRIKDISNGFNISFYEGGSKGSPYVGLVGLTIDPAREYNNWNEKCLSGMVYVQTLKPDFIEICDSPFNIGEHAIARIYERANLKFLNEFDVDLFSILPEFKMVPMWASFWIGNIGVYTQSFQSKYSPDFFAPVIPAKSGLFLGELTNTKVPKVEIRTFIHDKNLSDDQLALKKIMWNLGEGMDASPLALFPLVTQLRIDTDFYQNQILIREMIPHHELITRILFKNIEDDKLRYTVKADFVNFLDKSTKAIDQNFINAYRKLGVREAQLQIKQSVYKAKHGF